MSEADKVAMDEVLERSNGGNVTFRPGTKGPNGYDGAFVFYLADGSEVLKIAPDGSFLVRGEVVTNDQLVYESFRHWLAQSIATLGRGCTLGPGSPTGPAQSVCSSCSKPVNTGVVVVDDGNGGVRHVVGSPACR